MIAIGVLHSSASYISGALLDKSPAAAVEASGHELNIKAFFIEDKVLCKLCSYSVIFVFRTSNYSSFSRRRRPIPCQWLNNNRKIANGNTRGRKLQENILNNTRIVALNEYHPYFPLE
jgi:hypothetical protein